MQLTVRGIPSIEHHTASGSINNPAESANPGLLAVGAAPWYDTYSIEPYSSQGPTPDGRIKPDISGADCGETVLQPLNNQRRGFCGTSQSAAHLSGMAALVRQRFPQYSPAQVTAYLKEHAERRGSSRPNSTWGQGFARLPAPSTRVPAPTTRCPSAILLGELREPVELRGSWASDCESANRPGSYARFYFFTVEQEMQVQIDLESTQDTYMFLVGGELSELVAENDNVESGNTNSRITYTLMANSSYTVEATTYTARTTGDFTLRIAPVDTTAPQPTPPPTATPTSYCSFGLGKLKEAVERRGTWSSNCESRNRSGSYGKSFMFRVEQETQVQIDLESTQDTYLFLMAGDGKEPELIAENDDMERGNTNSRITYTLMAHSSYTVEATTYTAGTTGDFTLRIVPVDTTAPQPSPTDSCRVDLGTLTGTVTQGGSWTQDCDSANRSGRHARFYTFTLGQESEVQIDLESAQDTYLFLLAGAGRDGESLSENDDLETGNTNSRIIHTLAAGTYTVEATTYTEGTTGDFTLRISGAGGSPGSQQRCRVGLELAPGEGCSYRDFSLSVDSSGSLVMTFGGDSAPPDGLLLARSGNTWTVESLPSP